MEAWLLGKKRSEFDKTEDPRVDKCSSSIPKELASRYKRHFLGCESQPRLFLSAHREAAGLLEGNFEF